MEPLFLIVAGLGFLAGGGELLTAGASSFARALKVRPIIIGLTVVAFGTSMPEAFVSATASRSGNANVALANIIGSNIFNILLILGLAALVRPLRVESNSLRREVPFVIASSLLVWWSASDGIIGRVDAILFLALFFLFLFLCFRSARDETGREDVPAAPPHRGHLRRQVFLILASLLLLAAGAKMLVSGATGIARAAGVSELLIGLTIVAAGTSLPELAASLLASLRKKDDIAVGNVTGSNIFNLLFILAISALIRPVPVSGAALSRDIPLMVVVSLIAVPILRTGFSVSRVEGILLVGGYLAYLSILIQAG